MTSIILALVGVFFTLRGSLLPTSPKISELAKALAGWGGGSPNEQGLLDVKYRKISESVKFYYLAGSLFQIIALFMAYKGW